MDPLLHGPALWVVARPCLALPRRSACIKSLIIMQITLRTITDVAQAVAWLRSTYFYVRVKVRHTVRGVVPITGGA